MARGDIPMIFTWPPERQAKSIVDGFHTAGTELLHRIMNDPSYIFGDVFRSDKKQQESMIRDLAWDVADCVMQKAICGLSDADYSELERRIPSMDQDDLWEYIYDKLGESFIKRHTRLHHFRYTGTTRALDWSPDWDWQF